MILTNQVQADPGVRLRSLDIVILTLQANAMYDPPFEQGRIDD